MTLIVFIILGKFFWQAPFRVKVLLLAEKTLYKIKNIFYTEA
jgi:hypothetical protein